MTSTPTDSLRSFIAVPLAPALQDAVEEWQREFRATGADVRWVSGRQVHFTLKFLGEVAVATLAEVQQVCAAQARGTSPFELTLQGTGVFPHPRRPRVVWIGVAAGAPQLQELAAKQEAELVGLGFEREKKPYRAHLTLGRCRSQRGTPALLEALADRHDTVLGRMAVDHFTLMRSELTPHGAVYTVLDRFELGLKSEAEAAP